MELKGKVAVRLEDLGCTCFGTLQPVAAALRVDCLGSLGSCACQHRLPAELVGPVVLAVLAAWIVPQLAAVAVRLVQVSDL